MVIANPIFDVVFKTLMTDNRVALYFIETFLEETIEDLTVCPQDYVFRNDVRLHTVYRLDYIATIKSRDGSLLKVLIEIQKSKNSVDTMRFRNYLGNQYKRMDEVVINEEKQTVVLPIITIYLLGFNLPNIKTPVLHVNRQYLDKIGHQVLSEKDEFIERLTHDSYIIQLNRIEGKLQSRLERLLSVFEQRYFVDDNGIVKEYNYPIDDEIVQKMVDILHYSGTDPKRKKEIENEQEYYRTIEAYLAERDTGEKRKLKVELKAVNEKLKNAEDKFKETESELKEKDDQLAASQRQIQELLEKLRKADNNKG